MEPDKQKSNGFGFGLFGFGGGKPTPTSKGQDSKENCVNSEEGRIEEENATLEDTSKTAPLAWTIPSSKKRRAQAPILTAKHVTVESVRRPPKPPLRHEIKPPVPPAPTTNRATRLTHIGVGFVGNSVVCPARSCKASIAKEVAAENIQRDYEYDGEQRALAQKEDRKSRAIARNRIAEERARESKELRTEAEKRRIDDAKRLGKSRELSDAFASRQRSRILELRKIRARQLASVNTKTSADNRSGKDETSSGKDKSVVMTRATLMRLAIPKQLTAVRSKESKIPVKKQMNPLVSEAAASDSTRKPPSWDEEALLRHSIKKFEGKCLRQVEAFQAAKYESNGTSDAVEPAKGNEEVTSERVRPGGMEVKIRDTAAERARGPNGQNGEDARAMASRTVKGAAFKKLGVQKFDKSNHRNGQAAAARGALTARVSKGEKRAAAIRIVDPSTLRKTVPKTEASATSRKKKEKVIATPNICVTIKRANMERVSDSAKRKKLRARSSSSKVEDIIPGAIALTASFRKKIKKKKGAATNVEPKIAQRVRTSTGGGVRRTKVPKKRKTLLRGKKKEKISFGPSEVHRLLEEEKSDIENETNANSLATAGNALVSSILSTSPKATHTDASLASKVADLQEDLLQKGDRSNCESLFSDDSDL